MDLQPAFGLRAVKRNGGYRRREDGDAIQGRRRRRFRAGREAALRSSRTSPMPKDTRPSAQWAKGRPRKRSQTSRDGVDRMHRRGARGQGENLRERGPRPIQERLGFAARQRARHPDLRRAADLSFPGFSSAGSRSYSSTGQWGSRAARRRANGAAGALGKNQAQSCNRSSLICLARSRQPEQRKRQAVVSRVGGLAVRPLPAERPKRTRAGEVPGRSSRREMLQIRSNGQRFEVSSGNCSQGDAPAGSRNSPRDSSLGAALEIPAEIPDDPVWTGQSVPPRAPAGARNDR